MKHFLILWSCLLLYPLTSASAQSVPFSQPRYGSIEDIQTNAYIANPKFEALARLALNKTPSNFDFTQFRRYYAQTRQYDPVGTDTMDKMLGIAYHLDTTKIESTEYRAYLEEYQNLIMNHMAHLGIIMQALALSRTNARYGDPHFFKWVKAGLIRNILISGNGFSLHTAYEIITMAEETILFNYLGMRQTNTIPNQEGRIFYNMHDTENLATRKKYTIFVNSSLPMAFLVAKKEMEEGFSSHLYQGNTQ